MNAIKPKYLYGLFALFFCFWGSLTSANEPTSKPSASKPINLSTLSIPLKNPSRQKEWTQIRFDNLPANKVKFSNDGLSVEVDKSASPLIFPLKNTLTVKQVRVRAQVTGGLTFTKDQKQGSKEADDFVFRLGLVKPGKKTLSFLQRAVASKWVIELFKLAPKGSGIEHIEFINVPSTSELTGSTRKHPLSDLFLETFIEPINQNGQIDFLYTFKEPIKAVAIWLSIDGDNTKSSYKIHISEIIINPIK